MLEILISTQLPPQLCAAETLTLYMIDFYLALINRAGGLYGRILTEVVSTDRTQ